MTKVRIRISDLSAYLDGANHPETTPVIEAALSVDPDAAAKLRLYRQQVQELHKLYDGVLNEPIPARLMDVLTRSRTNGTKKP